MGSDITRLLEAWKDGERSVENELASRIYPILHNLAAGQVQRSQGALTLRATELVNEAFERLHEQREVDWQNRGHFFAIAATVMRRVVIDYLRHRSADKRGGNAVFVELDENIEDPSICSDEQIDWLALDQALVELAKVDEESARVVELRIFAGLPVEEIAELLVSSTATVARQWRFARVWLADWIAQVSPRRHG